MSYRRLWLAVLVTAAAARLLTLSAYPLNDTTEARYAEIARLMVVSGDWITPQIEMGVPFWAKPPLSIWLTASSFELFGFSEFAARLPSLLLTLLTLVIVFGVGRRLFSVDAAIASCAILLSSAVGFISSGAVMTDAALLLATTISLASFCMTAHESRPFGRYGLFVGLGLGLLAKGPIALILIGLPILVWTLWQKSLLWLWRAFPWLTGSLLMLAIAVPWYWLAEIRTPGFLEYFLLGEHWLRFVESGWHGDLYGTAHARPHGTIWLYAIAAALPWSLVAFFAAAQARKRGPLLRSLAPTQALLLLWAVTPLVFFTFAGNILAAYVLPGLPAFALLLGKWLASRRGLYAVLGLLVPALVVLMVIGGSFELLAYKTQKDLINYLDSTSPSAELYYFPKVPFSGSFYSGGRAQALRSMAQLQGPLNSAQLAYIAMRARHVREIPDDLRHCLKTERTVHNYVLLAYRGHCDLGRNSSVPEE